MNRQLPRFVSFAYAAADLLIEVGDQGEICFSMGAASGLTDRPDEDWLGTAWLELFHPDDRLLIQNVATCLTPGARTGPMPVRMVTGGLAGEERRALLNACRLPGNGNRLSCVLSAVSSHTAVSGPRDPESGLLERDSFAGS